MSHTIEPSRTSVDCGGRGQSDGGGCNEGRDELHGEWLFIGVLDVKVEK